MKIDVSDLVYAVQGIAAGFAFLIVAIIIGAAMISRAIRETKIESLDVRIDGEEDCHSLES